MDKINYLQQISNLKVTSKIEKDQIVYEFWNNDVTVKACFTYPKAKLFAQGVAYGRIVKNLTVPE